MKHGKFSIVSQFLPKLALGAASAAVALSLSPTVASAEDTETYRIDPVHSNVGFKVKHLFTFVNGRFDDLSGTISLDSKKPENSSVDVKIETKSINTANEKRDAHLRSGDFFDVEKHPTITFKSKSVKQTGENTADVVGDLTLLGVTKEVTLKTELLGKGKGMEGGQVSGWRAQTSIKRSDHGMTWGKLVEGTPLIGDEVEILIDVEAPEAPKAKAETASAK